jgi:cytoskeletal protein CcmA (bactofilin family)
MARSVVTEDSFINSIVGPGTFFRGHVELHGLLRIDGDFSGSVRTDGRVIVGKSGRADCAIEAGTVVVGGLFRGEVLAYEKVVLLSSCVVLGTVAAPRLIVEEGVLFSGRFRITGSGEKLVAGSEDEERRKLLLIETMQRREKSAAVRGTDRVRGRKRSSGGTPEEAKAAEVALGPGQETESWNG